MIVVVHVLLLAVITGLVHLVALFALPFITRDDAFSRLFNQAPINTLFLVNEPDTRRIPFADPAVALAICRYDLGEGPVRIRVPLSETYLAITFAEPSRGIYSSVSDRAATGGSLDVVLATQRQLDRITRLDDEGQAIEEIRIVAPRAQGLAILKVVVDRQSSRERAEQVLRDARCDGETLPE